MDRNISCCRRRHIRTKDHGLAIPISGYQPPGSAVAGSAAYAGLTRHEVLLNCAEESSVMNVNLVSSFVNQLYNHIQAYLSFLFLTASNHGAYSK